jgi:hypothetical protein
MNRSFPFLAIAQIADRVEPLERGTKYEDPLDTALHGRGVGRVQGGGSRLNAQFRIEFVDIEIALLDLSDALELCRSTLLSLGAPPGSVLLFVRDGSPRELSIMGGQERESARVDAALNRRLLKDPSNPPPVVQDLGKVKATATRILTSYKKLWSAQQEDVSVDFDAYDQEMREAYELNSQKFVAAGFDLLGDFTIADSVAANPKTPNFSRKFASRDGRMRASLVHMRSAANGPVDKCIITIITEFEKSFYLSTTSAKETWNRPPHLSIERADPHSGPAEVVALHTSRLQEQTTRVLIPAKSLAEVLSSELRSQDLTCEYRRLQKVPAVEELQRLGAAPDFAAAVHEEMLRLL